jgi:hypothetical protein
MSSSVEKKEEASTSTQEESPVDVLAKRWLENFSKTEAEGTDYTLRLTNQVGYWSSKFQDPNYEHFVCNRASLGFLCRALSDNLSSVDPKTEFGKHWTSVVRVCVPLLEQLQKLRDEFDPGDVKLEYGRYSDVDLYLEVFVDPKDAPRNSRGKNDHGSDPLVKAHVPTLVKEILQRVRHYSQSIPRRRRQSDVTMRFTSEIQKLTGTRDAYGWLPDQVDIRFEHKDGTEGRRYEEPFFCICLDYVRTAQAASRLSRHRNGVDSTVSVQGKTKRVSRPANEKSSETTTGPKKTAKSTDFVEVTKRKGKVGKHAGNPDRDRSKYDKNKERNEQRKAEKAEASKPMPKNQWDERRKEALKKQLADAQQELEKLEKKTAMTETTKEETLDEFVEKVAGSSN